MLLLNLNLGAEDKPAYKIYNSEGKGIKWDKMVEEIKDADIVLFGEQHDNPIAHWLEYELFPLQ